MADNYVQEGDVLTLTAPYTVVSGGGAKVGNIFGIALGDVTSAATGEFKTTGVFDLLAVTADVAAVGDRIYWDDALQKATIDVTGTDQIGVAVRAKTSSDTTVRVRLDGIGL